MVFGFFRKRRMRKENIAQYRQTLHRALLDDAVTQAEAFELKALADRLDVSPQGRHEENVAACRALWLRVTADGRVTPTEKTHLEQAFGLLGVEKEEAGFSQKVFNRGRVLDQIETGAPELFAEVEGLPVRTAKGEGFYWACSAVLRARKQRVKRVNYSGPVASIRIAKGLRYRVGSVKIQAVKEEYLDNQDAGVLWMTNQRLGFHGPRKSFAVPWSKVIAFEVTSDGLAVSKQGRETPYLILPDDIDVPAAVASYALNEFGRALPG